MIVLAASLTFAVAAKVEQNTLKFKLDLNMKDYQIK